MTGKPSRLVSLGMSEQELLEVLNSFSDPELRRGVAFELVFALLRVRVNGESLAKLIESVVREPNEALRLAVPGQRTTDTLRAVVYAAAGSALFESTKWLFARVSAESRERIYAPEIPEIPLREQPVFLLETAGRAPVLTHSAATHSALRFLYTKCLEDVAVGLGISEAELTRFVEFEPYVKRVMECFGYIQAIPLLRNNHDVFRIQLREKDIAIVRIVTAAGSRRVSEYHRRLVARRLERYLESFGMANENYHVDLSNLVPMPWNEYVRYKRLPSWRGGKDF